MDYIGLIPEMEPVDYIGWGREQQRKVDERKRKEDEHKRKVDEHKRKVLVEEVSAYLRNHDVGGGLRKDL